MYYYPIVREWWVRKQRNNIIMYGCSDEDTPDILKAGSKMFDKGV